MAKVEVSKGKIKVVKDSPSKLNIRIIIYVVIGSIVIFVFIIFPYMMKKRLIKHLNIHPDLLNMTPIPIYMVQVNKEIPSYLLMMNHLQVKIPINFIPTYIKPNTISFRTNPRKISRTISIGYKNQIPIIDLKNTGAISLFLSSSFDEFLYQILHSTWHPVKLYCKANFLVDQGINSNIYKTDWDKYHHAYIFPTPGNTGYIAKIFAKDKSQYIEFSMFDEAEPVKLQEWVDIAMTIKPGIDKVSNRLIKDDLKGNFTIKDYIDMANSAKNRALILQDCLGNYYSSYYKSRWLIPVGIVMYENGFYKELIKLSQYAKKNVENKSEEDYWNDLYVKAVNKVIKLDVLPNFDIKNIRVIVKNTSKFIVNKIKIRFVNSLLEEENQKYYYLELFEEGNLYPESERDMVVEMPSVLAKAKSLENISYSVESLNIID